MEHKRRAKSQGCQGEGTLRTTATRGCRREALLATSVAVGARLRIVEAVEVVVAPVVVAVVVADRVGVLTGVDSFAGRRVGDDGTEEARL